MINCDIFFVADVGEESRDEGNCRKNLSRLLARRVETYHGGEPYS